VAYPVGVTGELLVSYAGLGHASQSGVLSLELPNRLNATFSFPLVMVIIMLLYVPLFPPMYLHMFAQRKKVLGSPEQKKQE
jgi:very-long-chain (3R)-3-hydroxyacyl-CoA dehydratase